MKVPLRLIEFHVAHDCNLTCVGCSHFSPFARRQDVARTELQRDVEAAGRSLLPEHVHVMGGEPLLNRDLPALLPLFRAHFPAASIRVVSNGVLFPRAAGSLCEALSVNDVGLAVSLYPHVRLDRPAIERRCAEAGVKLEFWRQDTFLDFFDPDGRNDPAEARAHCPMEDACNVRAGRLFPCPVSAWADFGGFPFQPADGVELDAPPERLRSVLSSQRVTSLCRHCRPAAERRPHRLGPRTRPSASAGASVPTA
jgi:hypothetical protein